MSKRFIDSRPSQCSVHDLLGCLATAERSFDVSLEIAATKAFEIRSCHSPAKCNRPIVYLVTRGRLTENNLIVWKSIARQPIHRELPMVEMPSGV